MLIVDDEVQTRELLSEFCRAQGYEVATANDGLAAIAAITHSPQRFGIILTTFSCPMRMGSTCLLPRARRVRRAVSSWRALREYRLSGERRG